MIACLLQQSYCMVGQAFFHINILSEQYLWSGHLYLVLLPWCPACCHRGCSHPCPGSRILCEEGLLMIDGLWFGHSLIKTTQFQANEQPGSCCAQGMVTFDIKNENHAGCDNTFMTSGKKGFLCVYLHVCWRCAVGCALPDHGVWPPPLRPPVVSSYSSSLSSGASGWELNWEQGKKEKGKGEKKSEHVQIKWSNIFKLHLILIYCQNWFIYFYWLFFVHGLPVSWNSWIFMSGNLRDFEGIVSLACLLCSCSLNKIFMHFCDKTEVLLLSQMIKHLTPVYCQCSRLICVSEFISSTSYKLLHMVRAQQSLTGIFSHCKAYSCDFNLNQT